MTVLAAAEPPGGSLPEGAAAPTPTATATADEILVAISTSAKVSQSSKAVAEAIGKVREKPQEAVPWVDLGDALAQVLRDTDDRKYYDFAESAYQRALKINPRSADAMVGMAWVTSGRRAFDLSVDWAKRALTQDANNAAAHGLIGDVALKCGDYDGAYEHYQAMMDLKPDLSSWSRGATLLWITGNRNRAVFLMEKAIKAGAPFAENTAWCRAKYAMMLFNDGALVPAAQALAPALAAGTRDPDVLAAAGAIAAARHDYTAATQHYQKALEAGPSHEVLTALGDLCAMKGERDAAEKYYVQVESLYEANRATGTHDSMLMAKFYADHDRHLGDALLLAEERKLTKNVLEADILAWVYFKNGDQPHAIEAMKLALSRNTPDAELHFHAGMIAAAAEDRASAQKHLQQALSYNPHFNVLQALVAVATLEKLGAATPAATDAKTP